MKLPLRVRCLMVGLLALLAPAPASADMLVVVDARGGALQPGQTIDAQTPIVLQAGQRVTLIAANGATIKLSGPFEGVPDPQSQRAGGVVESLRKLASQPTQGTSTLGTVRAATGELPTQPWLIDVRSGGDRCVQQDAPVVFWRPAPKTDQTIEISPSDRAWQAQAPWPAGLDQLAMPPNFPAADAQTYIIAGPGTSAAITLHLIPPALDADAMRAAWMVEMGCAGQAWLLARTLR